MKIQVVKKLGFGDRLLVDIYPESGDSLSDSLRVLDIKTTFNSREWLEANQSRDKADIVLLDTLEERMAIINIAKIFIDELFKAGLSGGYRGLASLVYDGFTTGADGVHLIITAGVPTLTIFKVNGLVKHTLNEEIQVLYDSALRVSKLN